MHNEGNYIVSLGNVVRWLSSRPRSWGEIYPGFAAAELLLDEAGAVRDCRHRRHGRHARGHGPNYQPGMELHARLTLFASCRGSLTKELMARFNLREGVQPQTYGLGIKELWEIGDPKQHVPGRVDPHTVGWPVDARTYGGS
ncbi:MAG: hypothetical protein U1E17_09080 [Geminicoccaceae bacterium]